VFLLSFLDTITDFVSGFNAKIATENFFTPTIGNESLHEISNDTGVEY
jgi:hypothetical protein